MWKKYLPKAKFYKQTVKNIWAWTHGSLHWSICLTHPSAFPARSPRELAVGRDAPPGSRAGQQSPLLMVGSCVLPIWAPGFPCGSSARGWPAAEHNTAACIPPFPRKGHGHPQTPQSSKGAGLVRSRVLQNCWVHVSPPPTASKTRRSDCLRLQFVLTQSHCQSIVLDLDLRLGLL